MKNRMELKVSFVKTFHKTIDKLFTNVYNMSCKNYICLFDYLFISS